MRVQTRDSGPHLGQLSFALCHTSTHHNFALSPVALTLGEEKSFTQNTGDSLAHVIGLLVDIGASEDVRQGAVVFRGYAVGLRK